MDALFTDVDLWYRAHRGWLQQWLRRKLGCSEQAADLVQDTFVRLLRQPPQALQQPRAFLTRVAQSVLVDHWRRQALEQAWLATLASHPELEAPPPDATLELLQTLQQLEHWLAGMPPRVRQAFILSRVDGLAIPEIASELGVSRSSVDKYLARALLHCLSLTRPA